LGIPTIEDKILQERVRRVLTPIYEEEFNKYNLDLQPDKTRLISLNSKRGEGERSFDFLGFNHYLGKSHKGNKVLKRKTSSKKFSLVLSKMNSWIKQNRHKRLKQLILELNTKLRGYYNYYGIVFNS